MNAALRHLPRIAQPLAGLRRRWRSAARARHQRAELRALQALGQHELNDLGVGHSELPALGRTA
ncbi:hypothetical protein [Xenophilus sp. Marseille-Q4582]|uniref:hypothetical protein n=1 Tax=Xenophilus sp. Marseille-Q4582 TaxID=2866600 RepID=UPI001CE403E0|nr:hypothetical protein [Xenophilus sp. Marseille-Q4582]